MKHVVCILKFYRECLQKAFSNLSLIFTEVIEFFLLKNKLLGEPQKQQYGVFHFKISIKTRHKFFSLNIAAF